MATSDSQKYTTVRLLTLAWVPVRAHGVDVFFEREEQEIPRTELAGMQAGFSQIDPFCVACFVCSEGRGKTMSAHQVVFRCSDFLNESQCSLEVHLAPEHVFVMLLILFQASQR